MNLFKNYLMPVYKSTRDLYRVSKLLQPKGVIIIFSIDKVISTNAELIKTT